ncbi:hypothetical protein Pflav_037730 [Phytohabitans flavus]|uniref:Peptidase S11 D-alanyl-D-alanine carboxypeptidase A N-terminal domain-containing protein n=1 Tax=Phytohabitans flavus TaxID=1076124 RepID=A0A6F8XU55_9ACTN|nr:hypothetical protein Pflav_037730 [Phytohabitans flavus]
MPCPTEKLSPPPQRPPKPKAPALDPSHAAVGGEALATDGLAIPEGAAAPPKLTASTWLVADLDTGKVLGACHAHGYETPASVQKVLLSATMIPKLDPKQVVKVIREDLDIEPGSSAVGLIEGGKYSIETLWYGLLFDSGNDAANVLARLGGGDKGRAGGVAMMNAEARHLGALQTHAVTPSGLDGPGQFTSAYDLVLIARAAFALPDFRKYVAARTAKIPPQPPKDPRGFQIQNDNGLLEKYPGALGGKSGFTTLARHSFVGAAKRGDRTLVAAVLGAEARPIRASEQTGKLLDWGFALGPDASVGRLVEPGETDPKPTPTADGPGADAAEGAAARPSDGPPGSSFAAVIGLTVAVAAVVLVMLVAATRRRAVVRARQAALAERRAAPERPRAAPGAAPKRSRGGGGAAGRDDSEDWLHEVRPAGGAQPSPRAPSDERLWAPEEGGPADDPRRGAGERPPPPGRGVASRDSGRPQRGPARRPAPGSRGAAGSDKPLDPRRASGRGDVPDGRRGAGGRRDASDPGRRRPGDVPDERRGEAPGPSRGAGRGDLADGRRPGDVADGRRVPGQGEVSGGIYRPADPRPSGDGARRGPRPPSGPRPASGRGAPDDYYPPPDFERPARPDAGGRGDRGAPGQWDGGSDLPGGRVPTPRQRPTGGYPQPERRPPAQRRPAAGQPVDGRNGPPGDGTYGPSDRRPRPSGDGRTRGPAAPDSYGPRRDDG